MIDFKWTKEELEDSKIMEEMYQSEKEYQKSYLFNTIMTIIFYPLFKILEMLNKSWGYNGFFRIFRTNKIFK